MSSRICFTFGIRVRILLGAATALLAGAAANAQITLVPDTVNMFRDTRGANDVGIAQGDLLQFGANIAGGSLGVTLGATHPSSGFTVSPFGCAPIAVNANFCGRTTGFNAGRLDPWTLRFERGTDVLQVSGPSLLGTQTAVPFPVSVTMSGTGLNPTVSWQLPSGSTFAPDGLRINIFDKSRILPNGQADVIHSVAVSPGASSYTLPSILNNTAGYSLAMGGNYTVNFQLIETRGHVPFTNNNAEILRRSNSFFAFSPLSGNVPADVALPTVVNGVYNFSVANVGPNSVTFIDPFVAVGYDYAIGAGDPSFASVLLPEVGDGLYTLSYTDASGAHSVQLGDNQQYFFGAGGVGSFRVSGIETEAGLDPNNVTAFITGLTFTQAGAFTGTMTPITVFVAGVPEPGTWALMLLGLAGVAVTRCRRTDGRDLASSVCAAAWSGVSRA